MDSILWREIVYATNKNLLPNLYLRENFDEMSNSIETIKKLKEISRMKEAMGSLDYLSWTKCHYISKSKKIPESECHNACVILNGIIVIVGGWGSADNDVSIVDYKYLKESKINVLNCITTNKPIFRYGFTVTTINDTKAFVYGGFRNGGYTADCNCKYILLLFSTIMFSFLNCHYLIKF